MTRPKPNPREIPTAHRVLVGVVGGAFALSGILVLFYLWSEPLGSLHTPLFFRLFGSVIALVFVAFGGMIGASAIWNRSWGASVRRGTSPAEMGGKADYKCPSCGAGLSDAAEVSPSGDVKCEYCRTWFNVR